MSKSNVFEEELLLHIFNNEDITLIGDSGGLRGSVTPGDLYVSLHTGDPGEEGDQETDECSYTGYARVSVPRTDGGWTVTGDTVTNVDSVTFPECEGSTDTATHFAIGTSSTGGGKIIYSGEIGTPLSISTGITPVFGPGEIVGTED